MVVRVPSKMKPPEVNSNGISEDSPDLDEEQVNVLPESTGSETSGSTVLLDLSLKTALETAMTEQFKSVVLEHCYARPHNWRPDEHFLRPTKTLFIPKSLYKKTHPVIPAPSRVGKIDLEEIPLDVTTHYNHEKLQKIMSECDKFAADVRSDDGHNWEENIKRTNWTTAQIQLFNHVAYMLNNNKLARLGSLGQLGEPVIRRVAIGKSVKKFREILARYEWDLKLVQWLHKLLIENLTASYLGIYLEILQTLKHKVPAFVDKVFYGSSMQPKNFHNKKFYALLENPWNPFVLEERPKRTLPGDPILILVPSVLSVKLSTSCKNLDRWLAALSPLGTIHTAFNKIDLPEEKSTMVYCVDQMFMETRAKVQELKAENPTRPVVLIGINTGSALALQVAHVETIVSVICLGFSLRTGEGCRGDPDDNLLELPCPALFVIGQNANRSSQENLEDIRERMRIETGLLVVGSADDYLRIAKSKKRLEGINQNIVDMYIVDEVSNFLSGLLSSPFPPLLRSQFADLSKNSKRNNANGNSIPGDKNRAPGQQSLSPIIGRPPGTKKMKSQLDMKWQMLQQGIPTPNPLSNQPVNLHNNSPVTPGKPLNDSIPPKKETILKTLPNKISKEITTGRTTYSKAPNAPKPTPSPDKLLAMGIPPGRSIYHGTALSKLLKGGNVRTIPPYPAVRPLKDGSFVPRKQLITNRPKMIKKMSFMNGYLNQPMLNNVPANNKFSTEDIMDLPIIFADDNQMLANNTMQPSDTPPKEFINHPIRANPNNKYVFWGRPNSQPLKRPPTTKLQSRPLKYTKIILSKVPPVPNTTETDSVKLSNTMPKEISSEKIDKPDLDKSQEKEKELPVNKVTRPSRYSTRSKPTILNETCKPVNFIDLEDDSDDPEYIPNKTEI